MNKMPWMKEWKDKKTAVWRLHPHDIFGMFKLSEYVIDDNGGTYTASVEQWSKIIVSEEKKTKRFLNYLKDNINEVIVTHEYKKEDDKLVQYFTLTIEEIYKVISKKIKNKERVKNFRERTKEVATTPKESGKDKNPSLTEVRRAGNLERVISAYHPDKASLQLITARTSFTKIMKDCSKGLRGVQKGKREEEETQRILKYINSLKAKSIWVRERGRYLLGVGNFIKDKPWERLSDSPYVIDQLNSSQDSDIEGIMGVSDAKRKS